MEPALALNPVVLQVTQRASVQLVVMEQSEATQAVAAALGKELEVAPLQALQRVGVLVVALQFSATQTVLSVLAY